MDLAVDNRAAGGTSLGLSLWLFQEDVLGGRLDPKTTLFAFGVTHPQRINLFRPSPVNTLRLGGARSVGRPKYWCDRTITDIFTDGFLLWNHLQLLERISILAQRHNLTVAVFNMFDPVLPAKTTAGMAPSQLPLLEYQHNYVNSLQGFFLEEPSMSNLTQPEEFLGCGHPNHASHARFAQHVVGCLDRL